MSEKLARPQLGEWRNFSSVAVRGIKRDGSPWYRVIKEWRLPTYPKPGRGVYIGYRTVANGIRDYEDEEGYYFTPQSYREVWLFVVNTRQNPVHVFPECVEVSS